MNMIPTASDGVGPVLEIWRMCSNPFIAITPMFTLTRVVVPDRVPSIARIKIIRIR